MASNGSLDLKVSTVQNMYTSISEYQSTVIDALYDVYKSVYTLSYTNSFRGDSADAFKNYLREGTINVISGLMDVVSELTTNMQLIATYFTGFESASDGEINEIELDSVDTILDGHKQTYNDYHATLTATLNKAAQYIGLVDVNCDLVNTGFDTVKNTTKQIRTDLETIDGECLTTAEEMLTRITTLKTLIQNTINLCYDDGALNPSGVQQLNGKDWYQPQTNVALTIKLTEDPFEYNADAVSIAEDQWAAGLCSDVYAYAGYSWCSAEYESGREGNTVFLNAKASVLELNAYAQVTEYVKASASIDIGTAEAQMKAGWGDGYYGASIDASVVVAKAEASAVIGGDVFSASANASAEVLTADGTAAFEFEDGGQYRVGFKGDAVLCSASADAGFGLGTVSVEDDNGNETDVYLFGAKGEVSVGIQAGIGLSAESQTVYEFEYANINSTTVDLDLKFLIGVDVEFTIPTISLKWPW